MEPVDRTDVKPMRVIWSVCQTGGWDEQYIARAIDRAAAEGASGIELSSSGVDRFITYAGFPALATVVDHAKRQKACAMLDRLSKRAAAAGLTMGVWHHEIAAPIQAREGDVLLELLPELRAADGLIDLEHPTLYRLISGRIGEFLDLFPLVGEIVLTMTETRYPVMHRPFSPVSASERIRRVIQAAVDATESRGRRLVVRPFSAFGEDERQVEQAMDRIVGERVSVMYKTEPADWHAFLPDEKAFSRPTRFEVRAESDGGAEYYGQTDFPCCYPRHIARRFAAARDRGATVAVLRIDRGHVRTALDHPVNEGNVVPVHRWLRDPSRTLSEHVAQWLRERHGLASPALEESLQATFEVISHVLYLDGHAMTHRHFGSFDMAQHTQFFSLFEPDVPLDHLAENWAALWWKRSPTHAQILAEKQRGLALARELPGRFLAASEGMAPSSREAIGSSLARLELLAESALAVCRLTISHLREMGSMPQEATGDFAAEAAAVSAVADKVERELGPNFFGQMSDDSGRTAMPAHIRSYIDGLEADRRDEMPRRRAFAADANVIDYVLCGLASEGHRLRRRVHAGAAVRVGDSFARESGLGLPEGFGYTLKLDAQRPATLRVVFESSGTLTRAMIRIGSVDVTVELSGDGRITHELPVTGQDSGELAVWVWSASTTPIRVREIVLCDRS
jgi:hypothetical protein